MGWASGSALFSEVIAVIKRAVKNERQRVNIYEKLIDAFEESDWDTQDECRGLDPAYDKALKRCHPTWEWEE